ncbi:hypothetical protein Tco_0355772 [Tanacetum coccineum]
MNSTRVDIVTLLGSYKCFSNVGGRLSPPESIMNSTRVDIVTLLDSLWEAMYCLALWVFDERRGLWFGANWNEGLGYDVYKLEDEVWKVYELALMSWLPFLLPQLKKRLFRLGVIHLGLILLGLIRLEQKETNSPWSNSPWIDSP